MNDLCRCSGGGCLLKNNCLRHTAAVYGRQDFFGTPPYESTSNTCNYYIDDRPSHKAIQELAYSLWQKGGCPSGQNEAYWLEAEQYLLDKKRKQ